jgi:ParB family chromosome partitioning protein
MADIGVDSRDMEPTARKRPDMAVAIERVRPNPNQPRRSFDEERLSDLAASIAKKGILQPLIVRPCVDDPDSFEIVAGERRWRAAQRCGLHDVPVLVRDFDDTEVLEVAIIENVQRDDLNAIEEALGLHQLIERFGHTQEHVSAQLGKSRSHISNILRLLKLPDDVQEMVRDGALSAGHARALVGVESASEIARKVASGGLSVRETERLAKLRKTAGTEKPSQPKGRDKDADTLALEGDLSATLKMRVTIDHATGEEGGRLTVQYKSLDQLDRLCALLSGG